MDKVEKEEKTAKEIWKEIDILAIKINFSYCVEGDNILRYYPLRKINDTYVLSIPTRT